MTNYIDRSDTEKIKYKLTTMPAVAILGPRQCGKTTLAQAIIKKMDHAVYLDLERRADLNKLRDPDAFFSFNAGKLICLDEIQRVPELFAEMRSQIDRVGENGQFLVLGSASPHLIKQTSESLAGRISFIELTPFSQLEVAKTYDAEKMRNLWLRGGFPRSFLAENDRLSFEWREDFIRTFLERDIPQLGFNIPAQQLERFWQMCAHIQAQLLNRSALGSSLGVSHHTINSYIGILEQTYLLRVLSPYHANLKKRLVKSPKVMFRDTGLLHALLGIETLNDLLGHPVYGPSWEGFVIEDIIATHPDWKPHFYRSASGAEIDLIMEKGLRRVAFEIKASTAPKVNRSFWASLKDLEITEAWIIAPVEAMYPYKNGVNIISPWQVAEVMR